MVGHPDTSEIQQAIRDKYKMVASSAEGLFNYPTGEEGARIFAYDDEILAVIPPMFLRSFCGVGNPFAVGGIEEDDRVLDVGCGAGFDLFVASRLVGPTGKVFGIDITPEMMGLANQNIAITCMKNVEVREGSSEAIPFEDNSFDVVISNGVLNLSPRKDRSFEEIYRVLKAGGRLQFADIVLNDELPHEIDGNLEAWSS